VFADAAALVGEGDAKVGVDLAPLIGTIDFPANAR
jgi:hypothetical protein